MQTRIPLLAALCCLSCDPGDATPGAGSSDTAAGDTDPSKASFPLALAEPPPPPDRDLSPDPWLVLPRYCGNGVVEPGEQCDLASKNDDHGACTTACLLPACGDGFLQPGEECDAGPANTDDGGYESCTHACSHGAAYCGDHHVDADEGEECDHGPLGSDACTVFCKLDGLLAFVSSAKYDGEEVGGLVLADHHCKYLAAEAGLPRATNFMAWISSASLGAADRLAHVDVPYYRLDGELVAADWDDLVDGALAASISINEHGEPTVDSVWTNTDSSGASASVLDCNAWTLNGLNIVALHGKAGASGEQWTLVGDVASCSDKKRLYCLEQPQNGG